MGRKPISTRKCSICERTFSKEEITLINGKNYCPKCKKKKEKDAQDYKDLMAYIDEISNKDRFLMPMVASQIKKFKTDYNVTNEEILSTLRYMFELKEPPIQFVPESGIAILPYFFREAQLFYKQNKELALITEQKIQESYNSEPVRITIKRSAIIKQQQEFEEERRKKENRVVIDLDDIDLEEDDEIFEDKVLLNYKNKLEYQQKQKQLGGIKDWDN